MKRWVHKASVMLSIFLFYSEPHLLTYVPAHPLNQLSAPSMYSGTSSIARCLITIPENSTNHRWDAHFSSLERVYTKLTKCANLLFQIHSRILNLISSQLNSVFDGCTQIGSCLLLFDFSSVLTAPFHTSTWNEVSWEHKTNVWKQTLDL